MMRFLSKKNSRKVFIVGLDGVPQTLLLDYMDKGYLPEFKRILEAGYAVHQMDASIPDVSSTSWASFITGSSPAEHGIYGFTDLKPGSYDIYFPNSVTMGAPTIWEMIGKETNGKTSALYQNFKGRIERPLRSIVMNIPQTFPAQALNGVLTAGFVCPDLRKGTYPDSAYQYLTSIGYLSDVDSTKGAAQKDEFFKEVYLALEKRLAAYEHFTESEDWDFFAGVITETDRVHHFFFEAAYDPAHRDHPVFLNFYRTLDRAVGKLYDLFMRKTGGDGLFMTMSDHGFTKLENEVNVNAFLRKEGFLMTEPSREYFDRVDTGTRAFAMDPARVYVNLEGKYPRGCVNKDEKETVIRELKEKFLGLRSADGRPVIRKVYENHEIYDGPLAKDGPDLICLAHDGFDLKGNMQKDEVFTKGRFTGMHTSYDAHCILPRDVNKAERLHIENLAGIILNKLSD